jgi:hypothetical protein
MKISKKEANDFLQEYEPIDQEYISKLQDEVYLLLQSAQTLKQDLE